VGPRGFGQVGPRGVLTGGTCGRSDRWDPVVPDRWDPEGPGKWVPEGSARWGLTHCCLVGPCIVDGFNFAVTVIIQMIFLMENMRKTENL
jgi:hypothetical protein